MSGMPPLHPILVHLPVTLILVSLLFEIVGRMVDAAWWRKAAFAMLIAGTLGAWAAVLTGEKAGDAAEHQGVDEHAVDAHRVAGKLTLWLGIGAVVLRALAGRAGRARAAVAALALALHLAAAIAVGVAGYRGGRLVFDHGAGVRVHDRLVPSDGPPRQESGPEKD
jgi:uncharacterized membrane protein